MTATKPAKDLAPGDRVGMLNGSTLIVQTSDVAFSPGMIRVKWTTGDWSLVKSDALCEVRSAEQATILPFHRAHRGQQA